MYLRTERGKTDWDFSIELDGVVYAEYDFSIEIDSIEKLERIKLGGAFGSPGPGKTWEIEEALAAIKANPDEIFNNLGGNRGALWNPKTK